MEWEHGALGSLFAPEILTPEQYADERRGGPPSPVKRLMMAVLEDALRCFQNNFDAKSGPRQLVYSEAEQWLCTESNEALFSFNMVCEAIGINPAYLRAGLLRWREAQKAGAGRRLGRRSPVVRNGSILFADSASHRPTRARPTALR